VRTSTAAFVFATITLSTPLSAADSALSKSLIDARRSTSMSLRGNAIATVGPDYYIHADDLAKGVVKAESGDYYVILRFKQALSPEEVEKCCWLEDQSGEKIKHAILVVSGSASSIGYYVSPKGKSLKLTFRDHDVVIDVSRMLK
jgi:hypothetical protein